MNRSIRTQSPTRVDLAGGTLDLWPLYNFVGGATTINVAIDVVTNVELTPLKDGAIELESQDLGEKKRYAGLRECLMDSDPALLLLRSQVNYWRPAQGFSLKTSSKSPVGGGLGGSSSLTISLLKAFSKLCERNFASVHQMVHVAHNLEAEVLCTPTGTQDYYPAASGGLNILKYSANGIEQSVYPVRGTPMESHFLLVYTGKAHHSGLNNFEVLKAAIQKDPNVLQALRDLKHIAEKTSAAWVDHQWSQLPQLFQAEYEARVRLAPAFSSDEIKELHRLSLKSGADAVKICGAGGGGCVMVWVAPARRKMVEDECQKAGFRVLDARPVDPMNI